jgi:class 3 adenylate cyclase
MESHGLPGSVQVSESTRVLLKDEFDLEERGTIEVKGKGPMRTWLVRGRRA